MIDITRLLAGFAGLGAVEVCVLLLAMAGSSVGEVEVDYPETTRYLATFFTTHPALTCKWFSI